MLASKLLDLFYKKNIRFITGVPDSCTSELSKFLLFEKNKKFTHLIAPNEGTAVSLGIGHYLTTKKIPCIYLQNSGFGNATDPITNLCHNYVYGIPLILLIGWRGKPGLKDEPQHIIQGSTICKTLKNYNIPFYDTNKISLKKISNIINLTKKKNQITALLIDKNFFDKKKFKFTKKRNKVNRSDAINSLLKNLKMKFKLISSVGFNSREILLQNKFKKKSPFYLIGGMGHTLAVSLGSLNSENKCLVCVDGDGSFYMHQGSFSLIKKDHKLIYCLLDNSSHESVGEVNLNYSMKNFKDFAKSVGFKKYIKITSLNQLNSCFKNLKKNTLPIFIHIITNIERNTNLPRPSAKELKKIKQDFMNK